MTARDGGADNDAGPNANSGEGDAPDDCATRSSPASVEQAQSFYGRYAELYDLIATRLPLVGDLRTRAAEALALAPGDTVVDVACGTGANLPHLRERVGASGRVVGIDFTPGVLAVARERVHERGWENVDLVRGDAATPPACEVDAVVSSFATGMFPAPATAVDRWLDQLRPGGRIALLDAAPSRGRGAPLNVAFRAVARLGSPQGPLARYDESPAAVIARRVGDGHDRLRERTRETAVERPVLGFVWLTAGSV